MSRTTRLQRDIDRANATLDKEKLPAAPATPRVQVEPPIDVTGPMDLAPIIEHTLLKPEATQAQIENLCDEARSFGFRAVCVNPIFVEVAKLKLQDSGCLVVCVVGFPSGASLTSVKVAEAKDVIQSGADEVDMVISLGALKSRRYRQAYEDVKAVVDAAGSVPVKVILETASLQHEEKVLGCLIAIRAGAGYVKTSTGFAKGGATVQDVQLMRDVIGEKFGVKAAGGIRSFKEAAALVAAGATRLGCSASTHIVAGASLGEVAPESDVLRTKYEYSWNWFKYHAGQRVSHFRFFLLMIGVLLATYGRCVELRWYKFALLSSLFGALMTVAFYFLEVRNEELVNCGRAGLNEMEQELGMDIRKRDRERLELPGSLNVGLKWLSKGQSKWRVTHRFWMRRIQLATFLVFLICAGVAIVKIVYPPQ